MRGVGPIVKMRRFLNGSSPLMV